MPKATNTNKANNKQVSRPTPTQKEAAKEKAFWGDLFKKPK